MLDKSLRCFLLLGRGMGSRNFVDYEGATLDRIRTSGTFIVAFLKGFSEYEVRNLIRGVKIVANEFSIRLCSDRWIGALSDTCAIRHPRPLLVGKIE